MDRDELVRRLEGREWTDIEFKEARRSVPRSAYETVSAFANTEGGCLVFGVKQDGENFRPVGVLKVDKIQNDFLSVLRSGQKLNRVVAARGQLIEDHGRTLLAFHIPEARRQDKPIYLNGDITKSFIRRGAGDERCTPAEIERLLRDAADERHDGETVDFDPARCFDDKSLRWYRKLFEEWNPDHDSSLPHPEFLRYWGLVVDAGNRLLPTRAAILLFGADPVFRQMLPRPVVDWQWNRGDWSEDLPEERWSDRLVIEANLVKAWRALASRYMERAEKPFSIDPNTLRRDDRPPDYDAFREAAINLLIHQDYADHTRKPTIRFFDDRALLWNPGDSFVPTRELMEPREREVRNPRIVAAFRRIGLSEQAGTGIPAIMGVWRRLGRVPPVVENDRTRKAFQLTLPKEELLSGEQIAFQNDLGARLDGAGARAFAFVCREGEASLLQLRAVTGLSGRNAAEVAKQLATQGLVEPVGAGGRYALAGRLKERFGHAGARIGTDGADMDSAQVGRPPANMVTDHVDSGGADMGSVQVRPPANMVTDHVDSGGADMGSAQVRPPANMGADHVAEGGADMGSVQVGRPPGNMVTDHVDGGGADMGSAQVRRPSANMVTDHVEPLIELSAAHRKILEQCEVPRRLTEIMAALGVTGRHHFRRRHLNPLIRAGIVAMTNPERPRASNQRYVVTAAGARLAARRAGGG